MAGTRRVPFSKWEKQTPPSKEQGQVEYRAKRSVHSRGVQQVNFLAGGRYILGRRSGMRRVCILKNT